MAPLLIAGGSEAWLGYRDERARLNDILNAEARLAAVKIEDFIDGIREQLGWTVQLPWSEESGERRRLDALGLLRQVPAVESLTLVDAEGRERLFVSRIGLNRIDGHADLSLQPAVRGARANGAWFGPVSFHDGSEPFMMIAVAGNRSSVGVAIAEVNLKFIWEVISGIKVGRTGDAFVLDGPGRLVAHPDINLVLRADEAGQRAFQALRGAILARPGEAATGRDIAGETVLAAMAPIPSVDWNVIVKQPLAEAFGPLYTALWRTVALLVAGAVLAAVLAWWLAQRMIGPIRLLEDGVTRIGAGQFDHRIELKTGDEFERLATRFNEMAAELSVSQERSQRIDRLKRFLAPQVAELVDRSGDDSVLDGRRVEVVVVFCDLRGFTAFSARADTDTVIMVLRALLRRAGKDRERARGDADQLLRRRRDGAAERAGLGCRSGGARRRHGGRHAEGRAGAPGRLARAGEPAGLRHRHRHGAGDGGADRLRRTPRLHRRRQCGEPRFAPVRQRGGQPDPGGSRRRPGDRRAGASRRARCAGPEGIRPACSRVCRPGIRKGNNMTEPLSKSWKGAAAELGHWKQTRDSRPMRG